MKVFEECGFRRSFCPECFPENEVHPEECMRMCREDTFYLQCPDCKSRLWFDYYGFSENSFFCEECDRSVHRTESIQTKKLLEDMLDDWRKMERTYERVSNDTFLTSLRRDILHQTRRKIYHLRVMLEGK